MTLRTLVLGLGNPLLGDDAVGLKVAALVRERLSGTPGVDVEEEEAGGLRLMERMTGYDRCVLVDAAVTGATPGTIRRLSPEDLPTQRTAAAHGIDLPGALALGRQLGYPMPSEVRIVAIEAESVLEFRHEMTPAVTAAVEPAVAAVLEELGRLGQSLRTAGPLAGTECGRGSPRMRSAPGTVRSITRRVILVVLPPLLAFGLARIVLSAAAVSAGDPPLRPGSWCRFDCAHYVGIALRGYEIYPCAPDSPLAGLWCGNTAWLPGYPLLVRAAVACRLPPRGAALLVSGLFAYLTLALLWRVLLPPAARSGPSVRPTVPAALLALGLAAFFPGGLYAHAIYPLGPFGLATVLSLVLAARGRAVAAGLAGAAAAFTYPPGLLLAPVLAAGFLLESRADLVSRLRRAATGALLTVAGFSGVVVMQHHDTGNWRAFALVMGGYHHSVGNPFTTIAERVRPALHAPFDVATAVPGAQTLLVLVLVASAVVAVARAARAGTFGRLELFVSLQTAAFWMFPLFLGGIAEGLHRRETTLLPLVLLTVRLPPAWQGLLAAAAAALTYPMALLFFRGDLI